MNILEKDFSEIISKISQIFLNDDFISQKDYDIRTLSSNRNSKIFLVSDSLGKRLIIKKFFDKHVYEKELKSYLVYLKGFNYKMPKLIAYAENILVFTYGGIPISNGINLSNGCYYFYLVIDWVAKKYEFCKKHFYRYQYDQSSQCEWLVSQRLSRCNEYYSMDLSLTNFIEHFWKINDVIGDIYILEHGDLEIQNILCKKSSITIIDFGASFRSNGMNDFAMIVLTFFDYIRDCDIEFLYSLCSSLYGCSIEIIKKIFDYYMMVQLIKKLDFAINRNHNKVETEEYLRLLNKVYEKSFYNWCK